MSGNKVDGKNVKIAAEAGAAVFTGGESLAASPDTLAMVEGAAGNKAAAAAPKEAFSASNDPTALSGQTATTSPAQDPDGIQFSRDENKQEDPFVKEAKGANDAMAKAAKKRLEGLREPQPAHDLNSLFDKLMFIFKKSREQKTMRDCSMRNHQIDSGDIKEQMNALQSTASYMNGDRLASELTNMKNGLSDMARNSELPNMLKYPLIGAAKLLDNMIPNFGVELGAHGVNQLSSLFSQTKAASALGPRDVNKAPQETAPSPGRTPSGN